MTEHFALLNNGAVVETHSTREACVIAAIERGWLSRAGIDFQGDREKALWRDGIEVKPINTEKEGSPEFYPAVLEAEKARAKRDAARAPIQKPDKEEA